MTVLSRLTLPMVVEIAILYFCFYGILTFLRGTRGAGIIKALFFFTIIGFIVVNTVVNMVNLRHLGYVFDNLATLAAIFMIVIFHPEIRRGLVRLGQNPLVNRFLHTEAGFVTELGKAVRNMSREKIGGLIAIEREADLRSVVEGGVDVDSEVKSEILETIFWPGSALHDGAALIQNGRISAAGCILPLTENPQVSRRLGTRHRAAIGISEETDALAVIVSEETGAISIAHLGKLYRRLQPEEFEPRLRTLLSSRAAPSRERPGEKRRSAPGESGPAAKEAT